jgi:hypothetical protein
MSFQDVTHLIDALAEQLPIGGMVQHPDFSLHRSMSAIELMDPKMDTGMCRDVVPSVSERLREKTLPLRMSLSHAARVMDVLLCQETAHRMGCSMPTSIVTCMYTHDEVLCALQEASGPYLSGIKEKAEKDVTDEDVVTASVYAYSLALLKCTRVFYNVVKVGDIYEDEDFCDYERYPSPKQKGGRLRLVLGDHVSDEELSRCFDATVQACEARAANSETLGKDVSNEWGDLAARLQMRRSWWTLMKAVRPLSEKQSETTPKLEKTTTSEQPETTTSETKMNSINQEAERATAAMQAVRDVVSTQLHAIELECATTLRCIARVKNTMSRVWSHRNPEQALIRMEEQKVAEEKKREKAMEGGNVNEAEHARALEGNYDERKAIDDEGAQQYGVDHRVSKAFIPAGPPRQKTELHVPTITINQVERHVSHLIAVVKCQEYVVSVKDFENSQRKNSDEDPASSTKPRSTTTLQSMRDYMHDIVHRKCDVFSRSFLNLLILGPLTRSVISKDGRMTIRPAMLLGRDPMDEVIVSECLEYGLSSWMLNSSAGLQSLSFIIPAVLNGLRLHCITTARLHRRTSHLLADWGVLQNDVDHSDARMLSEVGLDGVDNRLYANRFGSYVLDMSLDLMRRQLELGFALDLYSLHESVHVHWYCGRLMHMQIQNRTAAMNAYRARATTPQPITEPVHEPVEDWVGESSSGQGMVSTSSKSTKKKGGKSKKKKGKKKKKAPPPTSFNEEKAENGFPRPNSATSFLPRHDQHVHLRRINELDFFRSISRAFQLSHIFMFRTSAVKTIGSFEMGTNALRFQNRFLQFHHFNQASPIHYKELADQLQTLQDASLLDLSDAIKKQFNYAASRTKIVLSYCPYATKSLKKKMKALAKLCVINSLTMSRVYNSCTTPVLSVADTQETTMVGTPEKAESSSVYISFSYKANKVYSTFEASSNRNAVTE